jgi:DcuC family C4-dicarboxylate transporter
VNIPGNILGCVAVIIVAVVLLFRRAEVRLVLLTASAVLFALAGRLPDVVLNMAAELSNAKTVIPICASMGFAFVLRLTECDKHLVQFLLRPLDRSFARALLIPGAIVAGYIVNMAIVSQSGAAAIVGSIAVPLLLRKGISRVTAGSLLLLGTSMGGELFNPGAVETVTLAKLTNISPVLLAQRSIPLNLLACTTALLVYWRFAVLWERKHRAIEDAPVPMGSHGEIENAASQGAQAISPVNPAAGDDIRAPRGIHDEPPLQDDTSVSSDITFQVNPVKAIVPFIPLALLFGATHIPLLMPFHDHVTILVAMLIGSIAAALSSPKEAGKLASAFFEGTGFAYAHIISVTVCATLFAQGIIANGLVQRLVGGLAARPGPALLASLTLPWGLAALSGSGAGSASSMMTALVPGAAPMHLNPGQMGILTAMGSHFGRTMSPAAAVAILCATLVSPTGTSDRDRGSMTLTLAKRVAIPLFIGGIVLYVAALLGIGR